MQNPMTFRELYEWYDETIATVTLKPNIREGTRRDLQNHVLPFIGERRLSEITPILLDQLFCRMSESGNMRRVFRLKESGMIRHAGKSALAEKTGIAQSTLYAMIKGDAVEEKTADKIAAALCRKRSALFLECTKRAGLSGASVNKIKRTLSAVFSAAVKKELMERNPCGFVTIPRVDTQPVTFLNAGQSRTLVRRLSEQPNRQLEAAILVLLTTGIRSGELLALYWEDMDFSTGQLLIRHTLARENKTWVRQRPKTNDSERCVVLPAEVWSVLRRHRKIQLEQRLKRGNAWENPELIFTNRKGGFLTNAQRNKELKRVMAGTDLPQNIHIHSLRHTYASLLINEGVNVRLIADRLGHASVRTTLDIYSHVFRGCEGKTAEAIEKVVFQK